MFRNIFIAAAALALGSPALASDLPTTKGPPVYTPPPPVFTWTGFYIGGQAGYQWGRTYTNLYSPAGAYLSTLPAYTDDGFVGGGHIGYNYEIDPFVLGVEGDVEGSTFSGATSSLGTVPAFSYLSTRIPLQGSLRGRIGYAWDRALLYATGGLELADVHNVFSSPGGAAVCGGFAILFIPCTPATPAATDSFWTVRPGWTVGAGLEYAIDPNWSVRGEYRYTDFGHYYQTLTNTYPGDIVRIRLWDSSVRLGFSYKFDWAEPVVSKY